jgi:hypothetical protein
MLLVAHKYTHISVCIYVSGILALTSLTFFCILDSKQFILCKVALQNQNLIQSLRFHNRSLFWQFIKKL